MRTIGSTSGVGRGRLADTNAWLDAYAQNYNAAYDAVMLHQSSAKVLISLEHHFGSTFDQPSAQNPILSGWRRSCRGLRPVCNRGRGGWPITPIRRTCWRQAFGPDDWPRVTYGNLGTLAGWLRKTFASTPSAWEIQLTESGVNSISPHSTQAAQADGVCRSLRNVLGTPGVEKLHLSPDEGPSDRDRRRARTRATRRVRQRQASVEASWALANRDDLDPPQLSCGFEDLPYTRLTRSYHATRGHWASSRLPPSGFTTEQVVATSPRTAAGGHRFCTNASVGEHNLLSPGRWL